MTRKSDSHQLFAVLTSEWAYGLDLMRAAGLRAGRFYPALWMLERAGDVEATWDDGSRPRRRLYRIPKRSVS